MGERRQQAAPLVPRPPPGPPPPSMSSMCPASSSSAASGGPSPPLASPGESCGPTNWVKNFINIKCQELLANPKETYLCPISHDMFKDPVVASDGQTYERNAIARHFEHFDNSPLTNQTLHSKVLMPNHFCKSAVNEYKAGIVQGILDLLSNAACELPVEALVERGLAYATLETEKHKLRKHLESHYVSKIQAADSSVQKIVEYLEVLHQHRCTAAVAESITGLGCDALRMICDHMDVESGIKVVVARERLLKELNSAGPCIKELLAQPLGDSEPLRKGLVRSLVSASEELGQLRRCLSQRPEKRRRIGDRTSRPSGRDVDIVDITPN